MTAVDPRGAESAAAAWIRSGAAALAGRPDGPGLVPPAPVLARIARLGAATGADPWAVLTERAAVAGLRRQGAVSCGGGTRLVRAADGWLAASLVRPEDVDAVAAWLEIDAAPGPDPWPTVVAEVAAPPPCPARRPGRSARPAGGCRRRTGGQRGRRRRRRSRRPAGPLGRSRPGSTPTPVGAARRGSLVVVGRAGVRPPAGRLGSRRGQGRVGDPARRRPPRPGAVLRPPPQRAAGGGARRVVRGGTGCAAGSARRGRRRDRGVAAPRPGPARARPRRPRTRRARPLALDHRARTVGHGRRAGGVRRRRRRGRRASWPGPRRVPCSPATPWPTR